MFNTPASRISRRGLLGSAGLGALVALGLPSVARAQRQWSADETRNVQVVNDLIAAFVARDAAKIAAQFTDDALFKVGAIGKMPAGRKPDFAALVKNASSVEMKVVETAAIGPLVMHDRYDRIISPSRKLVGRWIGIFALRDGRIVEFTDYTINYDDW